MQKSIWEIPAAEVRLKELHTRRWSCAQIADDMSREFAVPISRNGIIGKIHRLGLPPHSKPGFTEAKRRRRERNEFRISRAPVPSVPPPKPAVVEASLQNVSFADLQHGQCRYPFGEGPFTFCGCRAEPGLPYCEPHQELCSADMQAYRRRSASQQSRRDRERAAA